MLENQQLDIGRFNDKIESLQQNILFKKIKLEDIFLNPQDKKNIQDVESIINFIDDLSYLDDNDLKKFDIDNSLYIDMFSKIINMDEDFEIEKCSSNENLAHIYYDICCLSHYDEEELFELIAKKLNIDLDDDSIFMIISCMNLLSQLINDMITDSSKEEFIKFAKDFHKIYLENQNISDNKLKAKYIYK